MQSSIGIVRIFLIDNTNVSIYSAFDALEGLQVLFVKPAARRPSSSSRRRRRDS